MPEDSPSTDKPSSLNLFTHDNPGQCGRCGARAAVRDTSGILYCDTGKGGCGRPTASPDEAPHEDPALEKFVGSNGTGPLGAEPETTPNVLIDGWGSTDLANAYRLVHHFGELFRYVGEWGFVVWTGARWSKDRTDLMMRFAKKTTNQMVRDAAEHLRLWAGEKDHVKAAKKLLEHAETSESARKLANMIELSRSEPNIVALPESFDNDPFYLNCENGTVDLRTGEAHSHSQQDMLTKKCPTWYDPDAKAPTWEKFLMEVFGSQQLIDYIQRVFGYALTGSGREQVVFILHGKGSNGKSTLLNTVLKVMGEDYAAQIDATSITGGRKGGASNDIARLRGIRFVSSIEVGEGRRLNEALVKQFTGGDKVTARFLYKEFFEFQPEFKLFIAANHKPELVGQDNGMWRRVRLIPFKRTFSDEQRDSKLPEKLLAEGPGILAWLVRGALAWQKDGLVTPDVVKEATLEYRDEMNDLGEFLETYTWKEPTGSCGSGELYGIYRSWCENRHDKPMTQTAFGRRMHDLGYESRKERGVRVWHGIVTVPPAGRIDRDLTELRLS